MRYALGALKGVGEKAMEQLVEERAAKGPFKSLEDFAERVDPQALNRRQLESLAAGGAFDAIEGDRAAVHAAAETILAEAAKAHDQRTSGQGGLFGGPGDGNHAHIRLPKDVRWSVAERMAAEKEAFGFYFSAHPTDRYRHAAQADGARSYAAVSAMAVPEPERDERGRPTSRPTAKIAALIEEARWRTSARGNRYLLATCSDATGQFIVSIFDDAATEEIEKAAKAGQCLLLTCELDKRPGEETPRLTVRNSRPLEGLAASARLKMTIRIADAGAPAILAPILGDARGGRGEIELIMPALAGEARLAIGGGFQVDADLAASIEHLPGVVEVLLGPVAEIDSRPREKAKLYAVK
ncbi:DNA polymerase III alpha subunit [Sphingomonas vulcanisoli]|uniref:DNA polymerase III alpha subunit n=1 Tax=Sphingomonas vulcanisoli TaxID=1658060 RepID=A0ABX0TNS2_9SPHN|nr:DNA polymerase III alpha subunit [Sphingomonas vulcanisoli]